MNNLVKMGAACKMCGEVLMDVTGEPTNCANCEAAVQAQNGGVEVGDEQRDFMVFVTGQYLTAGCVMVAQQYIHRDRKLWPTDKEAFLEEATELLRYHAPIAYAYFFENSSGANVLPTGTTDIILELIWKDPTTTDFLGGKHSGIILPG